MSPGDLSKPRDAVPGGLILSHASGAFQVTRACAQHIEEENAKYCCGMCGRDRSISGSRRNRGTFGHGKQGA